jgi:hypothetical protein
LWLRFIGVEILEGKYFVVNVARSWEELCLSDLFVNSDEVGIG